MDGVLVSDAEESHLTYPDPLSEDRVRHLIAAGIDEKIARLDLEMVKLKLCDQEEGLGWSRERAETGEEEYKKYLTLCRTHGPGIVPTRMMDQFWHYHILDTRAYHEHCAAVFGGYLHHYPYFGMRGAQDERNLEAAFRVTAQRYEMAFHTPMSPSDAQNCWHDCQGRCWHACKSG